MLRRAEHRKPRAAVGGAFDVTPHLRGAPLCPIRNCRHRRLRYLLLPYPSPSPCREGSNCRRQFGGGVLWLTLMGSGPPPGPLREPTSPFQAEVKRNSV